MKKILVAMLLTVLCVRLYSQDLLSHGKLEISDNGRYFQFDDGKPFFWLGDTGWLLFSKLNREEAEQYLVNRKKKGFNVIQAMVLHNVELVNVYGDSALVNKNVANPDIHPGNDFSDPDQYDYWDHVDFIVSKAEENNLFMAMVPIWGSNVKGGKVSREEAKNYAKFLAERYKDQSNIIWLNGGDILGTDSTEIWKTIGNTINKYDPNHLITFHPRGRNTSSTWFHQEQWLDFNMFQSGHRRYDQDTARNSHRFGEDNWRYVKVDYGLEPIKPTLDGEPSYEHIPQGLHDPNEPLWTDDDLRRYAYWSVFTGAAGFTYGNNSVMQMLKPSDKESAYGAKDFWHDAIDDPGAGQMIHLKNLMLSRPYFERIPDQSIIANQGERYDFKVATKGENYAFIYTYTQGKRI